MPIGPPVGLEYPLLLKVPINGLPEHRTRSYSANGARSWVVVAAGLLIFADADMPSAARQRRCRR